MSIGVYAFTADDWKEYQYPLDLWIRHNERIFDQVCIGIFSKKLNVKHGKKTKFVYVDRSKIDTKTYDFYKAPLVIAQKGLETDWKAMIQIDEFLKHRIDTSKLNERYAYAIKRRELYGNAFTEITADNSFPEYGYRIHHGNRAILGDVNNVAPPYAAKLAPLRLAKSGMSEARRLMLGIGADAKRYVGQNQRRPGGRMPLTFRIDRAMRDPNASISFEVWHTNMLRNPNILFKKMREQTMRDIRAGGRPMKKNLNLVMSGKHLGYSDAWKTMWRNAKLHKLSRGDIPEIISENSARFDIQRFKVGDYSA